MDSTRKNKGLIRLFCFLLMISLAGCNFFNGGNPKTKSKAVPDFHKKTPHSGATADSEHPYGKPFRGVLHWEADRRFQATLAAQKMKVRMAAFQTTLPDPLPGEEANVALAADYLAGQLIKPGELFSMNRSIGPYSKARGFREGPAYYGANVVKVTGGGVCKIASTLYNVAILANLKIIERNPHSMPVPYVPSGQDATVSSSHKDFRFLNNSGEPVLIWADTRRNTLYMAIYGRANPPRVTWRHQILSRKPFRTFYQKNSRLKPGQEKIIIPGADGLVVKSGLTVKYRDGRTEYKDLGIDRYNPLPRVIEIR